MAENTTHQLVKDPDGDWQIKLKKPPIVEIWIEFHFDNDPNAPVEKANKFISEIADEFPQTKGEKVDNFQLEKTTSDSLPKVIGHETQITQFRIGDKEGGRWITLSPTQFVYHFLRLGNNYPGFTSMKEEVVTKLSRYIEIHQHRAPTLVAIHYVDIIEIPFELGVPLNISDYFTLGLDLPAPFHRQVRYSLRTAVQPVDGTGILELQLQMLRLDVEPSRLLFRMDWHKHCDYNQENGEFDPKILISQLNTAHQSVIGDFRAAFTDKTWAMFEPEESPP